MTRIMMNEAVEYASQVIDLCDLLMEHRHRLTEDQASTVETIYRRAVGFITDFMQHQPNTIQKLASYLNHDAMSPVTIMVGYSELLLMNAMGEMDAVVREVVQYIADYSHALHEELKDLTVIMVDLRTRLTA
jgi:light-regulated signal transduction histidine kinase (bacteriophytochrome)